VQQPSSPNGSTTRRSRSSTTGRSSNTRPSRCRTSCSRRGRRPRASRTRRPSTSARLAVNSTDPRSAGPAATRLILRAHSSAVRPTFVEVALALDPVSGRQTQFGFRDRARRDVPPFGTSASDLSGASRSHRPSGGAGVRRRRIVTRPSAWTFDRTGRAVRQPGPLR
jgi:hypothetical protein